MILVPAEQIGFGRYGHLRQAGHGPVTNEFCGRFWGFVGCLNLHGHEGLHHVNGADVDTTGVGAIQIVHRHCGRPSCPKCRHFWVSAEGDKIAQRIEKGSKVWGQPEHVAISVPECDKDLALTFAGYLKLRRKAVKVAFNRGLCGGCLIFHPFRYGKFSPHFHYIGFVQGGYTCRHCTHTKESCIVCDGVHGREMRGFKVDGYLVKVMGERRSILQTAHYQLGHSGYLDDVKSFRIVTWFGCMAYVKMRVIYVKNHPHCPICNCEFRRVKDLVVGRALITDVTDPRYHREFFSMVFGEDGSARWDYSSVRGSDVFV